MFNNILRRFISVSITDGGPPAAESFVLLKYLVQFQLVDTGTKNVTVERIACPPSHLSLDLITHR